jgi:hypothetical protein
MATRRARRPIGILAVAVLIGAASVASAVPAVAKGSPIGARWQLVDYGQSGCFSPNVHDTYYGVYINGSWRTTINVGASGLPSNGVYDTSYAPVPPGSSTGEYSLAYVHVTLNPTPAVGTYTAWLWASDGRTTQQVPVTIVVATRCGY